MRDFRCCGRAARACRWIVASLLLIGSVQAARAQDPASRDPWIAVDAALARGDEAAALDVARAEQAYVGQRLRRYIERRRGTGRQAAEREAIDRARSIVASDSRAAALLLAGTRVEDDTVLAVLGSELRTEALRRSDSPVEASKVLVGAAKVAYRIEWVERAIVDANAAGFLAYSAHEVVVARDAWEQSLGWIAARTSDGPSGDLLNAAGTANFELGALRRAAELFTRVVSRGGAAKPTFEQAQALMNLGNVHTQLGQPALALHEYDQAADAAARAASEPEERDALLGEIAMGKGFALVDLGLSEEADASLGRAIQMLEKGPDPVAVAMAHGNRLFALLHAGRLDDAAAAGEVALAKFRELKREDLVAQALANLAEVSSARGRHEDAIGQQREAIKKTTAIGNPVELATEIGALGRMYRKAGELDLARAKLEEARAKATELGAGACALAAEEALVLVCGDRLHAASALGDAGHAKAVVEATEVVRRTLDCLAAIGQSMSGDSDVHAVAAREARAELFDVGVLAAGFLGNDEAATKILEEGRALSLREQLGARSQLWAAVIPEPLAAELANAKAREEAALRAQSEATGGARTSARDAVALRAEAKAAQIAVREAVAQIQRDAKQAANLAYPQPDDADTIGRSLKPGDALVEYVLGDHDAVALVLRPGRRPHTVPLRETRAILDACEALGSGDMLDRSAIGRLTDLVWSPLGLGSEVSRVLVSPEGALTDVPFALLDTSRTVSYVPSGTVLGLLKPDSDAKKRPAVPPAGATALGDPDYTETNARAKSRGLGREFKPLPGARAEAKAVASKSHFLGADATEAKVRSLLSDGPPLRSLHFACHGWLDREVPWNSAIVLAATGEDDGLLTALEILQLRVRSDLVVLSGCQTGTGRASPGNGVLSLARAFMHAGAPRVIASLWKVDDDATKALMEAFYSRWNPGGMGAAECLRLAQAEVRKNARWQEPKYWAAWVLWGLPD